MTDWTHWRVVGWGCSGPVRSSEDAAWAAFGAAEPDIAANPHGHYVHMCRATSRAAAADADVSVLWGRTPDGGCWERAA